jgi:hypothetical protein
MVSVVSYHFLDLSTHGFDCAKITIVLGKITVSFAMALALFGGAMRLPAASCILSNAPSQEACKSKCCANMACCAESQKNTAPVSQPLAQHAAAKHQLIGLLTTVSTGSLAQSFRLERVACASVPARAHSLPTLAATCIRLI